MTDVPGLALIGSPTALITYGGLRILTDPTFDPPGEYPRPGTAVVLRKLAGPARGVEAIAPVDVVLLSHDHHADNLDLSGRAMLSGAAHVLSTGAGAERLDGAATGLEPGDAVELDRPHGGTVRFTAVPAEHGPPAVAAQHGPVDVAVLFVGGAQVPAAWGDAFLTLTAKTAVQAAQALHPAPIVPIHQDGWAHFTSGAQDVRREFAHAGLRDRLRLVAPGDEVDLA